MAGPRLSRAAAGGTVLALRPVPALRLRRHAAALESRGPPVQETEMRPFSAGSPAKPRAQFLDTACPAPPARRDFHFPKIPARILAAFSGFRKSLQEFLDGCFRARKPSKNSLIDLFCRKKSPRILARSFPCQKTFQEFFDRFFPPENVRKNSWTIFSMPDFPPGILSAIFLSENPSKNSFGHFRTPKMAPGAAGAIFAKPENRPEIANPFMNSPLRHHAFPRPFSPPRSDSARAAARTVQGSDTTASRAVVSGPATTSSPTLPPPAVATVWRPQDEPPDGQSAALARAAATPPTP